MGSVSLTGKDTLQLDSRVLADLADGDAAVLSFPNDKAVVKRGKNGNTIYALNEMGSIAELTVRIVRGSADDKWLNGRLSEQGADFSSFLLLSGSFVKRVGDGNTNVASDVYQCSGGIFKKNVESKTSAEGDTEQSVSVYSISFGNSARSIQ
jgi:hypothetical protein